jgi:hypothetical protein
LRRGDLLLLQRLQQRGARRRIGPRAVLTRQPVGFNAGQILQPDQSVRRWLSTTWMVTMSAVENNSSLVA